MAVIITCPHCGRMESWSPGEGPRAHCRFCKQALAAQTQTSAVPASHEARPKSGPLLQATLWGGIGGAVLGVAITLLFHGIPLASALIAIAAKHGTGEQRAALQEIAVAQATNLLVVAVAGFAWGALLMAVAGSVLQTRPELVRVAGIGAVTGAISPFCVVLIAATIPAIFQHGLDSPSMPAIFLIHWAWSLAGAAVGALLGLISLVSYSAILKAVRQ